MKTITLMAFLLVVLAGCAAKKVQGIEECNAARDAALRAASSCERCCQMAPVRK